MAYVRQMEPHVETREGLREDESNGSKRMLQIVHLLAYNLNYCKLNKEIHDVPNRTWAINTPIKLQSYPPTYLVSPDNLLSFPRRNGREKQVYVLQNPHQMCFHST
jgi:hypothetical protein